MSSLPKKIFRGLSALTDLGLSENQLRELPKEIFSDLNSLETLWLVRNALGTLPVIIFDDVLDTMGSNPYGPGLGVDYHLKAGLAFAVTAQIAFSGTKVTITMTQARTYHQSSRKSCERGHQGP